MEKKARDEADGEADEEADEADETDEADEAAVAVDGPSSRPAKPLAAFCFEARRCAFQCSASA